jgi:3-methyladenine DNA glycosylase AlkD
VSGGPVAAEPDLIAEKFVERLEAHRSSVELEKYKRYFKAGPGDYGEGDLFIGVRMGQVFALAAEFRAMPLREIEKLLNTPIHEARAGALRIMSRQARNSTASDDDLRELYELYLRRIDRINNWDLVDLAAWDVVGGYLVDRPRDILFKLARSSNLWERRTAILSTMAFIRHGDLDDTFAIAELLLADDRDLIQKATGWALREAGKQDRGRLMRFLDEHAATMPRTALRYAIERIEPDVRAHYLGLGKGPVPPDDVEHSQ